MHNFEVFNECVTDRPTDTAYYRDARTHLKMAAKFVRKTHILTFYSPKYVFSLPVLLFLSLFFINCLQF